MWIIHDSLYYIYNLHYIIIIMNTTTNDDDHDDDNDNIDDKVLGINFRTKTI